MARFFLSIVFVCVWSISYATDWAMLPGDRPFQPIDLAAFIATQEVRFYDGGRSEYGPSNRYAYIYSNEDRAEGVFSIKEDGSICIAFNNGFSRCDLYVRNGNRVLLIDQKGVRFPLR